MENLLLIVNGPAYGTENAYNAMRLARTLLDRPEVRVKIFLIGDGVTCALKGQKPPMGFYITAKMLSGVIEKGVQVGACGTCMDSRGITDEMLIEGVHRSTMMELAAWTIECGKVISF